MSAKQQPITEQSNPITTNIDVSSPSEIVSLLQKCDNEIFSGWQNYPGIFDERIQQNLSLIVDKAVSVLQNPEDGLVVFSGCGTSGRLGFITARSFNEKLVHRGRSPCYQYIIAGGDKALFTSQEAIEDDPIHGMEILEKVSKGKSQVLFIGITCGLSAPFVAGQLDFCIRNPDRFTPVLLGFNPVQLARNLPIEKWDQTFLQVVNKLENLEVCRKGFILNPVVGPEQITGSSRMKSGTATKILLEAVFVTAHCRIFHSFKPSIPDFIQSYKIVCDSVYEQKENIANVIKLAGESLIAGRYIYYLGWNSLGIVGMIDASECPPTYGATLDDVRGFIEGGFTSLQTNEGDISHLGKHFQISISDFNKDIVPGLSKDDLVVVLTKANAHIQINRNIQRVPCRRAMVFIGHETEKINPGTQKVFDTVVQVHLPESSLAKLTSEDSVTESWQLYCEIATKWILNSITTGAHILKGKVYQNIMVDLKVSNNKLYHRAVGIIQRFSGLDTEEAKVYLLKSVYHTDSLTDQQRTAPVTEHIENATPQKQVVPIALVAAILKCQTSEALTIIAKELVIRNAILSTLEKVYEGNKED